MSNQLQRLPSDIILASRNPHKLEELEALMADAGISIHWISALDVDDLPEVIEDRDTLEGNAVKKATEVAAYTNLPAVADDTGLEVDALEGKPGVYSARYAGEDATYQDNVDKLLKELANVPTDKRTARFRTVVAFVVGDQAYTFHGICEGLITNEQAGDQGFGYDPIFKPKGFDKTFAELDATTKNRISHRGNALQKLIQFLRQVG